MTLSNETAARKDHRTGIAPMQHRHFATIAAIIREESKARHLTTAQRALLRDVFADRLSDTNPRFDKDRFIEACKV